jgi:hypothetical protein
LRNTGERGLENDSTGLRTGRNSGYAAINLAVHLGATRIVLLGYDMRGHKQQHFFGQHPPRLRSSTPYASFVACFSTLVEPLRQRGVEVLNCTPGSALGMFRRAALRDAL